MNNEECFILDKGILTYSGKWVDIFDINPDNLLIEDIAHALSMMCRFNGHTRKFYSVAQHSLLVCDLVPLEDKLAALLHDASEAYIADIGAPFKPALLNYKKIEDVLMRAIADKFDFCYPFDPEIKKADEKALLIEWNQLMVGYNDRFLIMTQDLAEKEFLNRYEHLN